MYFSDNYMSFTTVLIMELQIIEPTIVGHDDMYCGRDCLNMDQIIFMSGTTFALNFITPFLMTPLKFKTEYMPVIVRATIVDIKAVFISSCFPTVGNIMESRMIQIIDDVI